MLILSNRTIPPASRDDLMTLKGIIYAIVNSYDHKPYVGKSGNTFYERYGPKWWRRTTNVLLQRTLSGHAKPEDFTVYILEHDLPKASLNERERHYADLLNAYCPYGYNIRECGEEGSYHCPEVQNKIVQANVAKRKTYHIQHLQTGSIITITNVREWCETNYVREMALRNLLCGIVRTSQGYCLPGAVIPKRTYRNGYRGKGKRFTVKHIPSGEIVTFENAIAFAETHGLRHVAFASMLNGKCKSSQGYCLPHITPPPNRLYSIIAPDGTQMTFGNMRAFERKHHVSLRYLRDGSHLKNRKGWKNLTLLQEGTAVHAPRDKPRPIPTDSVSHSM